MLNLFKNKMNNKPKTGIKSIYNNDILSHYYKDFPSSTREWKNSIYFYNKNALALIPEASKSALNIIKSYFNLYNFKTEKKVRKKNLSERKRKLSNNRIFVNRGEFKHTSNKVVVNLFVYNKQRKNLLSKIKLDKRLAQKFKFKRNLKQIDRIYSPISKRLKNLLTKRIEKMANQSIATSNLSNKNIFAKNKKISLYHNLVTNLLKLCFRISSDIYAKKLIVYLYYKQLIFFNKSKFKYPYLNGLCNLLKRIFNKTIEFNIVNLKYFYLNSDIFSEPLFLRLRNKRKRKTHLKLFNKYLWKIKIPNKNLKTVLDVFSNTTISKKKTNLLLNKIKNVDPINEYISRLYLKDDLVSLKRTILNNIKYKKVTGVRLEIKGRLSKRFTASRSVYKVKYKGNLINMNSSYDKLSSPLLRGNFRSNLQYTYLSSKTRIGSFGLKGWVSGN